MPNLSVHPLFRLGYLPTGLRCPVPPVLLLDCALWESRDCAWLVCGVSQAWYLAGCSGTGIECIFQPAAGATASPIGPSFQFEAIFSFSSACAYNTLFSHVLACKLLVSRYLSAFLSMFSHKASPEALGPTRCWSQCLECGPTQLWALLS